MEGLVTPVVPSPATHKTYVIVDLDGTLCNSAHRDHLAVAKEWDEFHSLLVHDVPHHDVALLLSYLNKQLWPFMDLEVIALTGRNEKYRLMTEQWMLAHETSVDHLLMRPDGDWRSDHELKPKLLVDFITGLDPEQVWTQEHIDAAKAKVWFILEDRDKVVEAWRNLGFRCWQTQPGGY